MKYLTEFQKELKILLYRHGIDVYCNVHDFVLASVLTQNIVQIAVMNSEERRLKKAVEERNTPDEPLSAEDAIRAMLDGEALYTKTGVSYSYSVEKHWFCVNDQMIDRINDTGIFSGLCRRPAKRPMTRFEVLNWANSEASRGWVVRAIDSGYEVWRLPQNLDYNMNIEKYQRARLLPDCSGADEDTIQGFEVEE
jgi:hypothetical protein